MVRRELRGRYISQGKVANLSMTHGKDREERTKNEKKGIPATGSETV